MHVKVYLTASFFFFSLILNWIWLKNKFPQLFLAMELMGWYFRKASIAPIPVCESWAPAMFFSCPRAVLPETAMRERRGTQLPQPEELSQSLVQQLLMLSRKLPWVQPASEDKFGIGEVKPMLPYITSSSTSVHRRFV